MCLLGLFGGDASAESTPSAPYVPFPPNGQDPGPNYDAQETKSEQFLNLPNQNVNPHHSNYNVRLETSGGRLEGGDVHRLRAPATIDIALPVPATQSQPEIAFLRYNDAADVQRIIDEALRGGYSGPSLKSYGTQTDFLKTFSNNP